MSGYSPDVDTLTDDQRAWLLRSELLWREAHAIAASHPGMDAGDVYHALRTLDGCAQGTRGRRVSDRRLHRPSATA
jgi:hypothetical protein